MNEFEISNFDVILIIAGIVVSMWSIFLVKWLIVKSERSKDSELNSIMDSAARALKAHQHAES